MKYLHIITILFLLINSTKVKATEKHTCGTDEVTSIFLNNNPALYNQYIEYINHLQSSRESAVDSNRQNTDTTYTLQVVVHIVYLNDNKYENIPDNIIYSQIDALNRDFNLLNADSLNLRPFFIPFRGNAKIKFELAKKMPNGNATNGITRTKGELGSLTSWSPISNILLTALGFDPVKTDFIPIINSKGKSAWDIKKYLNIWVCDLNYENRKCNTCVNVKPGLGTLLGIATPPTNAENWGFLAIDRGNNDGVQIDFRAFGINNFFAVDSNSRFLNSYNLGRTCVHEVGHYLGLQHTWGNVIPVLTPDGCAVDDFMEDTPEEVEAFSGSANSPCDTTVNTCTKNYLGRDYPDMYENYMDYASDFCNNLFTKKQTDYMRNLLLTRRNGLIIKREFTGMVTSVNPKIEKNIFSIYPNPATNFITIQNTISNNKNTTIEIFNNIGQLVFNGNFQNNNQPIKIETNNFSKGLYVVKYTLDTTISIEKFIKE